MFKLRSIAARLILAISLTVAAACGILEYVPPRAVGELQGAEVSVEGFWHGRESTTPAVPLQR